MASTLDRLTVRQREITDRVCRGLSNKEIGADLRITEQTVKNHLGVVFLKYGVRNRTRLVREVLAEAGRFPDG